MKPLINLLLLAGMAGILPGATVAWTEWKTEALNTMTGVITLPDASTVSVTFTGTHYCCNPALSNVSETASESTNLWANGPDSTYESATVENRPPSFGMVAIGFVDTYSITFSRPVLNPVMSWISVNAYGIQFDETFEVLSSGCGHWGCGTLGNNGTNFLTTTGEGHGTIYFPGTFSSLSFEQFEFEGYRAFTVGILGVSEPTAGEIPEPSAALLLGGGLVALAAWRRKTRIAQ